MDDLIAAARRAIENAYAPYSKYKVGAAVRAPNGQIWTGANMENVSYGLSLCAERAAIAKMVNEGVTKLAEVAVATRDGGTPCGMCLQTMLEFSQDPTKVKVVCTAENGESATYTLAELIPHGFKADL
jgi:cytidine deaminase